MTYTDGYKNAKFYNNYRRKSSYVSGRFRAQQEEVQGLQEGRSQEVQEKRLEQDLDVGIKGFVKLKRLSNDVYSTIEELKMVRKLIFMKIHPILRSVALVAAIPVSYVALAYPITGTVTGCWNPRTFSACVEKYESLREQLYRLAVRDNNGLNDNDQADMCARLGYSRNIHPIDWGCVNPSVEEMQRAIESYQERSIK